MSYRFYCLNLFRHLDNELKYRAARNVLPVRMIMSRENVRERFFSINFSKAEMQNLILLNR